MFSKLNFLDDIDLSIFNFPGFRGNICSDSRKVGRGDIFIAYKGLNYDARGFIDDAILKGASIIIYDISDNFRYDISKVLNLGIKFIGVNNLSEYAGIICSYILGNNLSNVPIIGVTGTNGKTSVSFCLSQIFELMGLKAGLIGTLGHGFINNLVNTYETTPGVVSTQNYIRDLLISNSNIITLEVSSHGLDQFRLNGVNFHTGIFTNLTRDHLDYHNTMEDYFRIKSRLFYWNNLRHAIINIDNNYGKKLYNELSIYNRIFNITTYGKDSGSDVRIKGIEFNLSNSIIDLTTPWGDCIISTSLIGEFNALNIVASLSAVCGLGYSLDDVVSVLPNVMGVPGRLEVVSDKRPLIIVDYAHTPDALENVLLTLRGFMKHGKLWCIFGCGGNRDKGKRFLMGQVARRYSDIVIVTSDNPRHEDPRGIMEDIIGLDRGIISIVLRQDAIRYAILNADYDDIILIAGKGHEKYQEINGMKYFFDDVSLAYNYLHELRY